MREPNRFIHILPRQPHSLKDAVEPRCLCQSQYGEDLTCHHDILISTAPCCPCWFYLLMPGVPACKGPHRLWQYTVRLQEEPPVETFVLDLCFHILFRVEWFSWNQSSSSIGYHCCTSWYLPRGKIRKGGSIGINVDH